MAPRAARLLALVALLLMASLRPASASEANTVKQILKAEKEVCSAIERGDADWL